MKRLLCLSALIVYIFACCPSSTTKLPTPIAEPATAQPLAVPPEPADTPVPLPAPTETPLPTDTPTPSPPLGKVTTSDLNVRAGPSTGYAIVGKLSLDDSVEVVGRNAPGDWLQVVYPANSDRRGWIAADYAKLTGPLETLPEVSAPPPPELTPTPLLPERVQAQVVRVVDGDTIEVSIEGQTFTVRYIGIDTPETKHPDKPVEPFGPEAAAKNEELVGGKVVELEKDVSETDRYGRLLRYVYVGDLMVNAELVRLGYAQASTYPPDVKYQDLFLQLQQEAREANRGFWGASPEPAPLPTDTPAPPAPPPGEAQVVIIAVDKRAEYVDIQNIGGAPQDLAGWLLVSEKGDQRCPLGGVIQPGEILRIWAMAEDADQGGYNCGHDGPIWNNSESDPAVLYDATGQEVGRK
jgi:micrococcal nuclease